MLERPSDTEYAPFYAGYVALVPEADVLAVLEAQPAAISRLVAGVGPGRETFRYAEGKWSVREVLGHCIDAERVFGHRAFCISRGEQASLPGFDEKEYVAASDYDRVGLAALGAEFAAVREANLTVLRRLDAERWVRLGTANRSPVSVRGLAFVMAGHLRHHLGVLRTRYGLAEPAG